jgi:hypothetical protein
MKLLGDRLQKSRPQALIDRGAQGEQHTHFAVIELERRHWAVQRARARRADHKPNREDAGGDPRFAQPDRNSPAARAFGILARRTGASSDSDRNVGLRRFKDARSAMIRALKIGG